MSSSIEGKVSVDGSEVRLSVESSIENSNQIVTIKSEEVSVFLFTYYLLIIVIPNNYIVIIT